MSKVISVSNPVKPYGGIKIVLESLNITEDRFRSAGDIEIFIKICFPHLFRKPRAVRITVLFQLCDQPNQPNQLFLAQRHSSAHPLMLSSFRITYHRQLDILCPTNRKKQRIFCSLLHPTTTADAILTHRKQKTAKSFWILRHPMLCDRSLLSRILSLGKESRMPPNITCKVPPRTRHNNAGSIRQVQDT